MGSALEGVDLLPAGGEHCDAAVGVPRDDEALVDVNRRDCGVLEEDALRVAEKKVLFAVGLDPVVDVPDVQVSFAGTYDAPTLGTRLERREPLGDRLALCL